MCSMKQPKPKDPVVKDPQYLRNPWLDGMTMGRAATYGRNALRIDPGQQFHVPKPPKLPPPYQPPGGGGGGGGGGGTFNPHPNNGAGGGNGGLGIGKTILQ